MSLIIKNLHAAIDGNDILKGLSLEVPPGEVHAIMGPNGSGKSTLSKVIAGHEDYEVTGGSVTMNGEDLLELEIDERSRAGLFLAFQYPAEVPGVTMANFIRAARQARLPKGEEIDAVAYYRELYEKMDLLGIDRQFTSRSVNEGFSGGEKKRHEILQMSLLKPKIAILDETDSGLDVDALRVVSEGVNRFQEDSGAGVLLITHYTRILRYITPDVVNVFAGGRIVETGGPELAEVLESEGYERFADFAKA